MKPLAALLLGLAIGYSYRTLERPRPQNYADRYWRWVRAQRKRAETEREHAERRRLVAART